MNLAKNELSENWMPDEALIEQVALHNIPTDFVQSCIAAFQNQIKLSPTSSLSLRAQFIKFILQRWRAKLVACDDGKTETIAPPPTTALLSMDRGWRPSESAFQALTITLKINSEFIEDSIPEFVIYWNERGELSNTWNSKFTIHVKNQWRRYKAALETTNISTKIPSDWKPSNAVIDVLRAANIDLEFANSRIVDFIIYWSDTGRTSQSWNTKFLQYIKFLWARKLNIDEGSNRNNRTLKPRFKSQGGITVKRTRDRTLLEDLIDRSWADGVVLRN